MKNKTGFTLVELLVVIGIAAMIMLIAVPSFQGLINTNRMATVANALTATINTTKSEAVRRGETVTLCASTDYIQCADTPRNWSVGWIVFVDLDADGVRDIPPEDAEEDDPDNPIETILLVNQQPGARIVQTTSNPVSFTALGFMDGEIKLDICDDRGSEYARRLWVWVTGHVKVCHAPNSQGSEKCAADNQPSCT